MYKLLWTTPAGSAVRIGIILVACLFLSIIGARADIVYTYTGLDFDFASGTYTTMDKVTGTFVLSSPLPSSLPPDSDESALLVSWSLSDGVNTFTGSGPTLTAFNFATGAGGEVLGDWNVSVLNSVGGIESFNVDDEKESGDTGFTLSPDPNTFNIGSVVFTGTWSGPNAVPEPSILGMTLAGLLGLGLVVGARHYRTNRLSATA